MVNGDISYCNFTLTKVPKKLPTYISAKSEPPRTIVSREALPSCARNRDRTGTDVTPLVFETNASTNSATRALVGTKVRHFSDGISVPFCQTCAPISPLLLESLDLALGDGVVNDGNCRDRQPLPP